MQWRRRVQWQGRLRWHTCMPVATPEADPTCRTRSGSWAATACAAARSHPSFRNSSHSWSGWPAWEVLREGPHWALAYCAPKPSNLDSKAPLTPGPAGLHAQSGQQAVRVCTPRAGGEHSARTSTVQCLPSLLQQATAEVRSVRNNAQQLTVDQDLGAHGAHEDVGGQQRHLALQAGHEMHEQRRV